jgi:hypothetical protein
MRYTKDNQVYTLQQVMRRHPRISFGPNTLVELGYAPYVPAPAPPTPEQLKLALAFAVEQHLNAKAADYRYKDYHAAMAYVSSPVLKFASEGQAFVSWVSAVWAHVDQVEQDVLAQLRAIPTPAELVAELPAFVAP